MEALGTLDVVSKNAVSPCSPVSVFPSYRVYVESARDLGVSRVSLPVCVAKLGDLSVLQELCGTGTPVCALGIETRQMADSLAGEMLTHTSRT